VEDPRNPCTIGIGGFPRQEAGSFKPPRRRQGCLPPRQPQVGDRGPDEELRIRAGANAQPPLEALDAAPRAGFDAYDSFRFANLHALAALKAGSVQREEVPALAGSLEAYRGLDYGSESHRKAVENGLEFTLGWCDLRRGALAEAEVRARKALAASPEDAFRHDLLARVLAARGDAEGARKARSDGRALAHADSFIARELADR